jgi:MFS family permease
MLQVPFGLSAFQSGSITFVLAIGSMLMKSTSPPLLRAFGFRTLLLGNAVMVGLMTMALALVRADTSHWLLMSGLLAFGFFRSLQFTCMNTLAYADLTDTNVSKGSSISSVGQQLSQSFGVALGATILAVLTGDAHAPDIRDFVPAFIAMGLLPLISISFFWRLSPSDGDQVSGHRAAPT